MSLTIKVYLMEDWSKEPIQIRRFNWTDHPTFDELINKVSGIYPEHTDTQHIMIKWKDDEGDWIDMTTDQEVRDAINACEANLLRLWTSLKKFDASRRDETGGDDSCPWKQYANKGGRAYRRGSRGSGNSAKMVHWGYACDGCNSSIYGSRYHCRTCSDYDICQYCFDQSIHSEHSMLEIRFPKKGRRFGHRDQDTTQEEMLKNVGERVAEILNPIGIDVDIEIDRPTNKTLPEDEPIVTEEIPPQIVDNILLTDSKDTTAKVTPDPSLPDPPPQMNPFFHSLPQFIPPMGYHHFPHGFHQMPPPHMHHMDVPTQPPIYPSMHFASRIPDDVSPNVRTALERLEEMGFDISKPRLVEVAKKNNGDLQEIINVMVSITL